MLIQIGEAFVNPDEVQYICVRRANHQTEPTIRIGVGGEIFNTALPGSRRDEVVKLINGYRGDGSQVKVEEPKPGGPRDAYGEDRSFLEEAFKETVGAELTQRLVEAQQAAARRAERIEKIAPVFVAFEELLALRKPQVYVNMGAGITVLGLQSNVECSLGECRTSLFYAKRAGALHQVVVKFVSNEGYQTSLRGHTGSVKQSSTYSSDWRPAFKQALEYLAPHIVSCEGSEPWATPIDKETKA